jgi:DnaJ homolog subfamily C member 28
MPDIEDHIRKAIEAGQFSNLPGKGKPLLVDENPYTDPEWRLAYHLLKSNGFTLPWIEKRQAIFDAFEAARSTLARSWEWRKTALAENQLASQVEAEWQRAQTAFRKQILALNQEILAFNLEAPSPAFQLSPPNPDNEIITISGNPG